MKKALSVLLYLFAVYHFILGLAGVLLADSVGLIKTLTALAFNFNLTMDTQTIWMIKPMAAYMLVAGIIAFFVAKKPANYKPIVYALAIFIAIRVVQRFIFALAGNEFVLNASPTRNIIVIVFLALYSISIFWLTKKA